MAPPRQIEHTSCASEVRYSGVSVPHGGEGESTECPGDLVGREGSVKRPPRDIETKQGELWEGVDDACTRNMI